MHVAQKEIRERFAFECFSPKSILTFKEIEKLLSHEDFILDRFRTEHRFPYAADCTRFFSIQVDNAFEATLPASDGSNFVSVATGLPSSGDKVGSSLICFLVVIYFLHQFRHIQKCGISEQYGLSCSRFLAKMLVDVNTKSEVCIKGGQRSLGQHS